MPELYMHIGYPRTGTTSLQSFMAQFRDDFAAAGILIPPAQGNRHRLLQALGAAKSNAGVQQKLGLTEGADTQTQLQEMLSAISQQSEGYQAVFMSEETVAQKTAEDIEGLHRELSQIFSKITVIVTFREHQSLLKSEYLQRIGASFNSSLFKDFAAGFFGRRHFNYCETLGHFCDVFGKENVAPVFYRSSAQDSSNKSILRLVGGDELAEKFDVPNKNASMDSSILELKRRLNPVINEMITEFEGTPNGQVHNLTRQFLYNISKTARFQAIAPFSSEIEPEHAEIYAADWQKLCTDYGDMFSNSGSALPEDVENASENPNAKRRGLGRSPS